MPNLVGVSGVLAVGIAVSPNVCAVHGDDLAEVWHELPQAVHQASADLSHEVKVIRQPSEEFAECAPVRNAGETADPPKSRIVSETAHQVTQAGEVQQIETEDSAQEGFRRVAAPALGDTFTLSALREAAEQRAVVDGVEDAAKLRQAWRAPLKSYGRSNKVGLSHEEMHSPDGR